MCVWEMPPEATFRMRKCVFTDIKMESLAVGTRAPAVFYHVRPVPPRRQRPICACFCTERHAHAHAENN